MDVNQRVDYSFPALIEKLKKVQLEKGLSGRELAKLMGAKFSTTAAWLNGRTIRVRPKTLNKICTFLDEDPDPYLKFQIDTGSGGYGRPRRELISTSELELLANLDDLRKVIEFLDPLDAPVTIREVAKLLALRVRLRQSTPLPPGPA